MYSRFRRAGFGDDAIRFLYGDNIPDVASDGVRVCFGWHDGGGGSHLSATSQNVELAITNWAVTQANDPQKFPDPRDATLYLYLLDHGDADEKFYLYDPENLCAALPQGDPDCNCPSRPAQDTLAPGDLKGWIDTYQSSFAGASEPEERPKRVPLMP